MEIIFDFSPENEAIICGNCQSSFRLDAVPAVQYQLLQDRHYYDVFEAEKQMLLRVKKMYERHALLTRIPLEESNLYEPSKRFPGFIQKKFSTRNLVVSELDESEKEVVEYLRGRYFQLEGRLRFVTEQAARRKPDICIVSCPRCKVGELKLDPQKWADPNAFYD